MDSLPADICQQLMDGDHACASTCVHLAVSDNGVGMDKKTQARVFEPYFTTKEAGKGTGLGLPMVMGCVDIHGGWIGMQSTYGKGTTVDIYLPISQDNAEEMLADEHDEIHPGQGELILLADDNQDLCSAVAELLQSAGYRVITACDGDAAMQMYLQHSDALSLVMLDCVMPKRGGIDVAEAIWQHAGGGMKTVLMTGYDFDSLVSNEWICGEMPLVLRKPWKMDELNTVLKSMHQM